MKTNKFLILTIILTILLCVMTSCKCEHEVIVDAAVDATCTKTGLTEGSHCNLCSEILVAQEVVSAKGHIEATNESIDATCTETGLTEGTYCSVCDEILVAQEVVPANGHTEVIREGKEATCTDTGLTEGTDCSVCGEVLIAQETIPAKGHTEVIKARKEATCTATGLTEGKDCSVCGAVLKAQKTIAAKGHTGEWSCERCSYSAGSWQKKYFVDEFNDPTSEWYIGLKTNAIGTFSDSATTNSKAAVNILYGQTNYYPELPMAGSAGRGIGLGTDYFNIFLYKYGDQQVKNSSTYYSYEFLMKIKTESGKVYEVNCLLPTSQDRIWVYDHSTEYGVHMQGKHATNLKQILMEGGKLKIALINIERNVEQYNFEIDASNFKDEISKLK